MVAQIVCEIICNLKSLLILSNTYEYKTRSDFKYLSKQIKEETIRYGNSNHTRKYEIDSLGNITKITDNIFGNHEFTYDYRGFLVKADNETYSYDSNGNMTKKGSITLTYDSVIKDRLTSFNGTTIEYDSANPLNPKRYGSNSYTFEGRRLTRLTYSGGYYEYSYNDQGQRIQKKDYRAVKWDYTYDGNRLIRETSMNGKLDFLYDEYGSLYGFIKDDDEKFFYIRDRLQNILGIINISGQIVVKYNCDAWGNHEVLDGNGNKNTSETFIGNINPIRYKGYYYDKESNMYYCQSRYYVPEWCRWLNADSIGCLEINRLDGLNLFAYCGNDPVNYKQRPVSLGGTITSSLISVGDCSVSVAGSSRGGNPAAPWWATTAVGAIPDFILGMRYLAASGMHSKFAYATNTRYMHPIMGGTWRWFGKSSSGFGTVVQGTFKQILTGDARVGFGAIAKSVGGVVGLNALVNFGFNFYENNWQVDSAMLVDTAIDTAIGVGSYYLAAGAMSLTTAGLLTAGVALPGIVVVGGVVILSIGFEHLIRAISGYWD